MSGSVALFMGALLDALIGPNIFVPGEPFLIAAGYQFHQGMIGGVIAVLLGGLLGDQLSYFIGKRYGRKAQHSLIKWKPKTRRLLARCRFLLQTRGNVVLMFARLLGPIAWFVPFVAGVNQIQWRRFSLFSSIGLCLGVGQFIFLGYALSYGLDKFPWLIESKILIIEYRYSITAVFIFGVFLLMTKKLRWKK